MKNKAILIFILILAFFLRTYGINWDQGQHLHPDERFLTMVGNAMKIPPTYSNYFDSRVSTLNPNNVGFGFYVYGTFPVVLNKIIAVIGGNDNYGNYTIQGRFLSALVDLLVIIFIYKIVFLLEIKYTLKSSLKYWASLLYASMILPIQLSHFFAVDTFLNFFMFGSFYFILKFSLKERLRDLFMSAVFFGFAIASKLSAFYILPLSTFFILLPFFPNIKKRQLQKLIFSLIFYAFFLYVVVRLSDPHIFRNGNPLDPSLNPIFLQNLRELNGMVSMDAWFPPAIQWFHKTPLIFSFLNLFFFGIGPVHFLLVALGALLVLKSNTKYLGRRLSGFWDILSKEKAKSKILNINFILLVISLWVLGFFIYQSTRFVKIMRYFIFIYPFLSILAAFGVNQIVVWVDNLFNHSHNKLKIASFLLIMAILIWPLMFLSIYLNKHTRVVASEWIYENIPNASVILSEHWDDSLPVPMEDTHGKQFNLKELPVFGADNDEKWGQMNELLQEADYYILSSNRGWGSIPTVPERYPLMSRFYDELLNGKFYYKKIKEFTSYPKLTIGPWSFELNDDWADESFTVYDHPKVMIFKNIRRHE